MGQDWRRTRDYRVWRAHVIRRDKVCQICSTAKSRQAHHMEHGAYNVSKRFDVSNGVCLCSVCHKSFHIDYKRGFRKKGTAEDYRRFKLITELKNTTTYL